MGVKPYVITLVAFLLAFQVSGQRLMHSIGATPTLLLSKENPERGSETFSILQTVLTYFPRYNFIENENSSVCIGAPVGVGFGIVKDFGGYYDEISFAYELPAVIDYNFGCKATREAESNFGGYIGAGFGYFKINISDSYFSNFSGATYGPIFRDGLRFASSNENWNDHWFQL